MESVGWTSVANLCTIKLMRKCTDEVLLWRLSVFQVMLAAPCLPSKAVLHKVLPIFVSRREMHNVWGLFRVLQVVIMLREA